MEMLKYQQICLYILKLDCVPWLDIIKLSNLYNQQTSQRKALVTLLTATPLVRTQWHSFISQYIIIKILLQVQPYYLQSSRLITKSMAISAHYYISTSKRYSSFQYFILKALVYLYLQQVPIKYLTKSIILGQKQYQLRSL